MNFNETFTIYLILFTQGFKIYALKIISSSTKAKGHFGRKNYRH